MSAFIVSDNHIWQIVHALNVQEESKQALVNKLKAINIRSVNHRYNKKTRNTKCKRFPPDIRLTIYDVIRLIQCWSYQSCEDNKNPDFHAYNAYLLSHFTRQYIDAAKDNSKIWSI